MKPKDLGPISQEERRKLLAKNIINDQTLYDLHASNIGQQNFVRELPLVDTSIDKYIYNGNQSLDQLRNSILSKNIIKTGDYSKFFNVNEIGKSNLKETSSVRESGSIRNVGNQTVDEYREQLVSKNIYSQTQDQFVENSVDTSRSLSELIKKPNIKGIVYANTSGKLLRENPSVGNSKIQNEFFNLLNSSVIRTETRMINNDLANRKLAYDQNLAGYSLRKSSIDTTLIGQFANLFTNSGSDQTTGISINPFNRLTKEELYNQALDNNFSNILNPMGEGILQFVAGTNISGRGLSTRPVPKIPNSEVLFRFTSQQQQNYLNSNIGYNKYRPVLGLGGALANELGANSALRQTYINLPGLFNPGSTLGVLEGLISKTKIRTYENSGPYVFPQDQGVTKTIDTKDLIWGANNNGYNFDIDSILEKTNKLLDQGSSFAGGMISEVNKRFELPSAGGFLAKGSNLQTDTSSSNESYFRGHTKTDNYDKIDKLIGNSGLLLNRNKERVNTVLSPKGFAIVHPSIDGMHRVQRDRDINLKRYMLSIENLAWKDEDKLFINCDLEKGPNGGRIMWFPPYDLQFSETSNATWTPNEFLGRPEPIYTYANTRRSGTLSFKIIVDHSTIINKLSNNNVSQKDLLNFIAGQDSNQVRQIFAKLSKGITKIDIDALKCEEPDKQENTIPVVDNVVVNKPLEEKLNSEVFTLYYENDIPKADSVVGPYNNYIGSFLKNKSAYKNNSQTDSTNAKFNDTSKDEVEIYFTKVQSNFNTFQAFVNQIKQKYVNKRLNIEVEITSSASPLNNQQYNNALSARRSKSVEEYLKAQFPGSNIITKIKVSNLGEISTNAPFSIDGVSLSFGSLTQDQRRQINSTGPIYDYWSVYSKYAFYTRNSQVKITKIELLPETEQPIQGDVVDSTIATSNLLDVFYQNAARIKTPYITEGEYFRYLEEAGSSSSFNFFDKFSEKIKFFHPAFHSTTPEGMNARLTFLQQSVRPGSTIKKDDSPTGSVVNAIFGRPPVCVLRIGDFINTKMVINSLSISYEPFKFDMNRDGIGIQPMIATISLGIDLIGGQHLDGPINKLQNALSFEFYANTHLYDPRSFRPETDIETQPTPSNINNTSNSNINTDTSGISTTFNRENEVLGQLNNTIKRSQQKTNKQENIFDLIDRARNSQVSPFREPLRPDQASQINPELEQTLNLANELSRIQFP